MTLDGILTYGQAAKALGVTEARISQLVARKQLTLAASPIPNRKFVVEASVRQLVDGRRRAAEARLRALA